MILCIIFIFVRFFTQQAFKTFIHTFCNYIRCCYPPTILGKIFPFYSFFWSYCIVCRMYGTVFTPKSSKLVTMVQFSQSRSYFNNGRMYPYSAQITNLLAWHFKITIAFFYFKFLSICIRSLCWISKFTCKKWSST